MPLPDFYVIGAPKAGSTALHAALAQHPQLFLSAVKEPKYFLTDGQRPDRPKGPGDAHSVQEWVWRPADYQALFADAPAGKLRGESTPFYLWSTDAHRRIQAATPDARMIAVVRDPVERAYSNWTHLWCDGYEPEADFLTACRLQETRAAAGWAPFWRYLEVGRYGEQLDALYSRFAREQVHVLRYRDLVDRPAQTLDAVCAFLGVETGRISAVGSANVSTWVPDTRVNTVLRRTIRAGAYLGQFAPPQAWRTVERPLRRAIHRGHRNRPELSERMRSELTEYFVDDVARLSELTATSYADWLSPQGRGTYSVRKS